jgi:hypothetical protein
MMNFEGLLKPTGMCFCNMLAISIESYGHALGPLGFLSHSEKNNFSQFMRFFNNLIKKIKK